LAKIIAGQQAERTLARKPVISADHADKQRTNEKPRKSGVFWQIS